jgi:hypothetical protein
LLAVVLRLGSQAGGWPRDDDMALPVVTVASGGLPVVDMTATAPLRGLPITEVTSRGMAVTKVSGTLGLPVTYVTADGQVVVPTVPVSLDPATVASVVLTNSNLTATNTGTTSADQGARVASSGAKTSGKFYFEVTRMALGTGVNVRAGIGTTASTYTTIGNTSTVGNTIYAGGNIWANGSDTGITITAIGTGAPVGIAVDLDNRMIWFRKTPAQNWNSNVSANPATNVGGIVIPAGTMVPFCTFGGTSGNTAQGWTFNFGTGGFAGAVPAGFYSGWLV